LHEKIKKQTTCDAIRNVMWPSVYWKTMPHTNNQLKADKSGLFIF